MWKSKHHTEGVKNRPRSCERKQERGGKARGTWVMQHSLASWTEGRLTESVSMEGIRQD